MTDFNIFSRPKGEVMDLPKTLHAATLIALDTTPSSDVPVHTNKQEKSLMTEYPCFLMEFLPLLHERSML